MHIVNGRTHILEDRLEGHVENTCQEPILHPGKLCEQVEEDAHSLVIQVIQVVFLIISYKSVNRLEKHALLVILVRLEIVDETSEQVDLGQVEQGVVDIDPLLIQL